NNNRTTLSKRVFFAQQNVMGASGIVYLFMAMNQIFVYNYKEYNYCRVVHINFHHIIFECGITENIPSHFILMVFLFIISLDSSITTSSKVAHNDRDIIDDNDYVYSFKILKSQYYALIFVQRIVWFLLYSHLITDIKQGGRIIHIILASRLSLHNEYTSLQHM
ncbi:hypothetical protein ACJX0J_037912, partial [Zea mays]